MDYNILILSDQSDGHMRSVLVRVKSVLKCVKSVLKCVDVCKKCLRSVLMCEIAAQSCDHNIMLDKLTRRNYQSGLSDGLRIGPNYHQIGQTIETKCM